MGSMLLIAGLLILGGFIKSPVGRGILGECFVNLTARFSLDPDQYAVIPNITLAIGERTSQIDHLIISEYGIFVIETKNMSGWIYGSENDEKWTQVIYKYKKRFPNPLRQNYAHVCAIAELLEVPKSKIFPIVVFAGDAAFKTPMPANVLQHGEYIRYIKTKTEKLLTRKEVVDLIAKVFDRRLVPSWRTRRRHIENLKKRFAA